MLLIGLKIPGSYKHQTGSTISATPHSHKLMSFLISPMDNKKHGLGKLANTVMLFHSLGNVDGH